MFKFFRQYNKIILVVGGCVLMVAFLVPQAVQMFGPNPAKEKLGTMHGQTITRGQAQSAASELAMLGQMPFGTGMLTDDEIDWLMIQSDAQDMGLYASDREVDLALEAVGYDAEILLEMATNRRVTVDTIKNVVRRWLIAEQYRQTVMGTAFREPRGGSPSLAVNRLESIYQSLQQMQQFGDLPPQYRQQFIQYAIAEANGTRRLSAPLLAHFIQDNYANVTGRVALIRPDTDAIDTPDDETLTKVFDTYKNNLPGTGEPFPFGYMYPNRVKLTYLQIPMRDVRDQVNVEYLDVLDAYKANPARFAGESGEAPATPTSEAVATLTEELTDRRAEQLGAKIMATVQSLLAEHIRGQAQVDGYLQLSDDYEPLSWDAVIAEVKKQHGVTLRAMGEADEWMAVTDLQALPGIGLSTIGEGQGVPFGAYVNATQQLVDDPTQVLRGMRTQVGVASKPLRGFDGNLYLFRLLGAQKAHAPESLDEVREQVVADAKEIAAYEQLVAEAESWKTKAVEEGLDAAAEAGGVQVQELQPFQKVSGTGGEPPLIQGVGVSREFVDAAFGLVHENDGPTPKVDEMPMDQRVAVTPLPSAEDGPALAVFVLDAFEPLTRTGYERAVNGGATVTVDLALDTPDTPNPLSREALAERVGFDLSAYEN